MEEEFFRNWEVMKPLLLRKWSRLHEEDFRGVQPDMDDVIQVIQKKYDLEKGVIRQDLLNLDDQIL